MKHVRTILSITVALVALAGCASFPTANQTVSAPPTAKPADIIEAAIGAANSVGLPPATNVDKANGLVQFGDFGKPVIGFTAQVRIRADGNLDVTVTRGSVYIPLPVDDKAKEFVGALTQRLSSFKAVGVHLNGSPFARES